MVDIVIKLSTLDTTVLASLAAISWDTTMKDYKEAILLTKVITELVGDWPNITNDRLIAGLAYGDTSDTQIAAAINSQIVNTEDAQNYRENQTSVRGIIDIRALVPPRVNGDTAAQSIEWRLPKGGLPSAKGNGFKTFVFNPNGAAALSNGPTLDGVTKWMFARMG